MLDLVVTNAKIATMDPARPRASALGVRDGRITGVGTAEEIARLDPAPRQTIDAGGRAVLPGFIEGHMHVISQGVVLTSGDDGLASSRAFAEIRLGSRRTLSQWALTDSGLINNICEWGSYLPRDVFVTYGIPNEDFETGLKTCSDSLVSFGITSIHDLGSSGAKRLAREGRFLVEAARSGRFKPRVYLCVRDDAIHVLKELGLEARTGVGDDRLKTGFVKIFIDGTMTGRSAAVFERYADWPTYGFLLKTPTAMKQIVTNAYETGFEVAVHAIGDRAIYHTLEAMEEAAAAVPGNHRPRLEHCRLTSPVLNRWARDLRVTMVPQQAAISFVGLRDVGRVGEAKAKWLHPYATWLSMGLRIVGSSDAPVYFPRVESNPFLGIKAAVTRQTEVPGELLAPEEAVTLDQALRMWTIDAAYAAYEEKVKGSLEPGKLADFVVLNRDPFAIPAEELDQVQVDLTFIDGEKVFERDPDSQPRLPEGKPYFREVEKLFK